MRYFKLIHYDSNGEEDTGFNVFVPESEVVGVEGDSENDIWQIGLKYPRCKDDFDGREFGGYWYICEPRFYSDPFGA